jgi:hypothetical protein
MRDTKTISWIFLAVANASEEAPADYKCLIEAADAINHAIPTNRELQDSIDWLLRNDLILIEESKYALSKTGSRLLLYSKGKTKTFRETLDKLNVKLQTDYD